MIIKTPVNLKHRTMLDEYQIAYKPQYRLFEGQEKNRQYSAKSLQSVLKRALAKKQHKETRNATPVTTQLRYPFT